MGEETLSSSEHDPKRAGSHRLKRGFALLSTVGLMLVVGAGVFMVTGIAGAEDDGEATPTVIPTATPTAAPTFTPTPPLPRPVPPVNPKEMRVPLGPIDADRAVVYTGDGDCLNVRPVPSTRFESDPRFCLNEGEIVYLHGEVVEADGEQWRYALGRGWLASQYVRMEPREFDDRLGGFTSVFLLDQTGGWATTDAGARLHANGRLDRIPQFKASDGQPGEGVRFSPDGNWVAYTLNGPTPSLRLIDLARGGTSSIEGFAAVQWSEQGKLLVVGRTCDPECRQVPAWLYPWYTEPVVLGDPMSEYQELVWAPDGESVVGTVAGKQVVRYWLDGTSETLVEQVAEDVWLGELSVSPDGRSLLAGGIAGPLRIVDLETGAISEFERAPQPVQAGNRCGGSIGKLSDWLAGGRIVYHESLAQKGSNGITIGDLRTGRRQVLSFWNIADLDAIGPDLVTFTSFEQMNEVSFQLTWLLDTATGEARPVAVGTEAGWVR